MAGNVNETPSFAQVIQDHIEARLCDVHVALPASVEVYDHATQKATVQPQIKRIYRDGDEVLIPKIQDVPVAWPRANSAFLHFPLKKGDQVLLIFSERSIDEWKSQGGEVTPSERRKHAFSDAFALAGGYSFADPATVPDAENLWLIHDKAMMKMRANGTMEFEGNKFKTTFDQSGKFKFEGNGGEELMKILSETLDLCSKMTTNTIFGPLQVNEFAQFTALKTRLDKLKKG